MVVDLVFTGVSLVCCLGLVCFRFFCFVGFVDGWFLVVVDLFIVNFVVVVVMFTFCIGIGL